jgi:DNA-binding transcriptional LysR family regulator
VKCCWIFAIAEERSFTKAAKRLAVSPSAMSHAIRGLEETPGVRLLSRTTRSVAPTEAGEQLLARLRPALTDVQDALNQLSGLRDNPAGRVRLLVPRLAGTVASNAAKEKYFIGFRTTVVGPKLAKFTRDYPEVVLEVTADDSRMDIVCRWLRCRCPNTGAQTRSRIVR